MVALMTLAVSNQAQAIENPNPKGTKVLGLHAGYYPGFGFNATFDYTLVDSWWKGHFNVGGYLGFNSRSYNYAYYRDRWTNFALMPRATYGLNITKEFEVHAGVMLGLCMHRWAYTYDDGYYYGDIATSDTDWNFCHGEVLGARYMFTPKFGAEVEFNYCGYMSWFNVGVTMKL